MLYAIKSPGELGTVSSACIHSPAQLIPSLQQTLQPSKVDVYTIIARFIDPPPSGATRPSSGLRSINQQHNIIYLLGVL